MKGLILKDLYCTRFQLILALLLALPLNLLMIFAGGGMLVELAGTTMEIVAYVPYAMINFMTITCFGSLMLNTLKDDVSTGWSIIQMTMPICRSKIVTSKMLSSVVFIMILVLFCYIQNVFATIMFGGSAEILLVMPIAFGMVEAIALFISFPLALRLGTKLAEALNLLFIITEMIGLTIALFIIGDTGASVTALRLMFYVALPLITLLAAVISHKAAQKALLINIERE